MNTPSDQAARDRIVTSIGETLIVEAGAGTGKTRALVSRIVRLLLVDEIPLREIAAITFTEAAAAELRDRVRSSLEQAMRTNTIPAAGGGTEPIDLVSVAALANALHALDDATITTLHGFAHRILADHPLEAGLPPRFAVRDEIQSSVAFEEGWSATLDALLEDPDLEPVTVRGLTVGLSLARLRDVARAFHSQWHRTREWLEHLPPALQPVVFPPVVVDSVLQCIDELIPMADHNMVADDVLDRLFEFGDFAAVLRNANSDDERLSALMSAPSSKLPRGRFAANWHPKIFSAVRDRMKEIDGEIEAVLNVQRAVVLDILVRRVGASVVAAADERRRVGELDFHDLLVLARDLVRANVDVRTSLHTRYRRLLIDEFQDTDPLQIEIATLLAAADPATAADQPWHAIPLEPGRLFVVGDPKQSIYRFRHADVALYAQVLSVFADHRVALRDNFRSVPGLLQYVNAAFPTLFAEGLADGTQVAFEPLVATRATNDDDVRVRTLGGVAKGTVDLIREREAADIAAVIHEAVADGWPVQQRLPGSRREPAAARYADIAILLPTRTSLHEIEKALDEAGIAYRVESKSLVYATSEVRELLAVLAAIEDPTDEVALVAALRTPAFACADDDLLDFKQAGGRWDYRNPGAEMQSEHRVIAGMHVLHTYHQQRRWLTVSELVDRLLRDRKFFELALAARRPRDRWRRYRFVADQARAFCGNGGRDLRAFLAWAERQADERAAVNEVVAPETDDDAVRILTVHGSKGLEFPIVVLAGLNVGARTETPAVIWTTTGCEVGINPFATAGYEGALARERAMSTAERVRLLYVAATRAEDHLVVSLHHTRPGCDAARLTDAAPSHDIASPWTPSARGTPTRPVPTRGGIGDGAPDTTDEPAEAVFAARAAWQARRATRVAALRRASVVAATGVAALGNNDSLPAPTPVVDVLPVATSSDDDDAGWVEAPDPPRRRGRAGTARGRAVHAVLQTVDLATSAGLAEAARAQAEAEGIGELVGEVETLVRAALAAPVVQEAVAASRRWKELAVATPVDDVVLEGFIDLLYEDAGGRLVLVDYKTDRLTEQYRDETVAHYRLQLAAYAAALEAVLGRPVDRAVLLFVGSGEAIEEEISDLAVAVSEVRSLLATEAARLAELRNALRNSA